MAAAVAGRGRAAAVSAAGPAGGGRPSAGRQRGRWGGRGLAGALGACGADHWPGGGCSLDHFVPGFCGSGVRLVRGLVAGGPVRGLGGARTRRAPARRRGRIRARPSPECRSSSLLHGARPRSRRQVGSHRAMGCPPGDRPRYGPHTFNCPPDRGQTDCMADQYAQSGEDKRPAEIPAIRWEEPPEGPVLVLLDQTRLPAEEVELVCTDAPALVEAIRVASPCAGRRCSGSPGRTASRSPPPAASTWTRPPSALAGARPTAVNLSLGVRRARAAYQAALAEGGDRRRPRGRRWRRRGRCTGRTPRPARGWRRTGWRCSTSCCPAAGTGCSPTATPGRWCRAGRARRSRWRSRRTGRGGCGGCGWTRPVRCCRAPG